MRGQSPLFLLLLMIEKSKISDIAEQALEGSNNFLVDVNIGGTNNITIRIDGEKGVNIDQCAKVSRFVESKLDRDTEDFSIEVTSFGLNQEYKLKKQFFINKGKSVIVIDSNDKKHKGLMTDVAEDYIIIDRRLTKKQKKDRVESVIKLDYADIKSAKTEIRI